MKMSEETFNVVLDDVKAVIGKVLETKTRLWPNSPEIDPSNLTMRNMWDILLVINMDRSAVDHPRHHEPTLVPRCLEYTDRSAYWLWEQDGGLDDSHIETAFKKMISIITKEHSEGTILQGPSGNEHLVSNYGSLYQLDWRAARDFDDDLQYTLISGWSESTELELAEGSKIFDYVNRAFKNGLYEKVANVNPTASDVNELLELVFRESQSLENAWFAKATESLMPIGKGPYRSTSVGDVVEVDGEYFFTAPLGFKRLVDLEINIDTAPIASPSVSLK
jgi:hypothetical protein